MTTSRTTRAANQPRIAVVSTGLGHVARGVETWANDLATALNQRGVRVTLFKGGGIADRPFERVVACAKRDGKAARWLQRWSPPGAWRLGFGSPYQTEQTTFALNLIWRLMLFPHHIVHLQDPWLALWLEWTAWLHGAKVILAHGTEEPVDFLRWFKHVQELSPFYLERHREVGRRHWFCIPNFVDVEHFQPCDKPAARRRFGIPPDAYVVLSVGALRRTRKRMDWLVEEFRALGDPAARLVIAGAREDETAGFLQETRAKLGDQLIILANLPHDQMPELYSAADVFVLCSLEEILGIAFLEAMACGLPCLGHTFPVTTWVIGDGGSCVDMRQPGALAAALTAYRSPAVRADHGAKARARACAEFSKETVVSQMLAMYQEVLSGKRGPGALTLRQSAFSPTPIRDQPPAPQRATASVSVIIPAYNVGDYLVESIESALNQTYPPHEIIVVDDGSTDDTAQVARRFQDRIHYIYQPNRGPAAARNRGIAVATGRYVAFLDGDDVWFPHKLERQIPWMEDHPAVSLLSAPMVIFESEKAPPQPLFAARGQFGPRPLPLASLLMRNRVSTSCVVVHRETVLTVGGFDERWRGPEDYDLWLRIADRYPIARADEPLVYYRVRPGGLSLNAERMKEQVLAIHDEFLARTLRTDLTWRTRQRARAYVCYQAALMHQDAGKRRQAWRNLLESWGVWPLPLGFDLAESHWARQLLPWRIILGDRFLQRLSHALQLTFPSILRDSR